MVCSPRENELLRKFKEKHRISHYNEQYTIHTHNQIQLYYYILFCFARNGVNDEFFSVIYTIITETKFSNETYVRGIYFN